MLWVDHENYFGPDRRVKPSALRLRERRRANYAGAPPPLTTALRQLRLRVLDARGGAAMAFADRANALALLAHEQHEPEAADALTSLASTASRGHGNDVRPFLYSGLDRVHAQLRAYH